MRRKLLFGTATTLTTLIAIELFLAALHVPPLSDVRDPFLDFSPGARLFVRDGDVYRTNPVKLAYFNHQTFPAVKPDRALRIFCLGGSTTYGRPYDDRTSYVGWLRRLLPQIAPETDWEVINCGGESYSSFRLANLMQELIAYQPDLFIFYEGHNEFLEERTYRPVRNRSWLINAGLSMTSRLRTATVLSRALGIDRSGSESGRFMLQPEVDAILDRTIGPESYHRDAELRKRVLQHYRLSLERMCRLAEESGAQFVFVQPACNLRDFSPFKSESGPLSPIQQYEFNLALARGREAAARNEHALAAEQFLLAARGDSRHAATRFAAGQALLATGDWDGARREFIAARDEDVCPLRAPSEVYTHVQNVGREFQCPVVDFVQIVEDHCQAVHGHRIPGNESFLDHVHPTLEMHRVLAEHLLSTLHDMGLVVVSDDLREIAKQSEAELQRKVTSEDHARALGNLANILSWAGKDLEALVLVQRAEQTAPGIAQNVSLYARLLEKTGDVEGAFAQHLRAVELDPEDSLSVFRLGRAYFLRGDYEQAERMLARSIRFTPDSAPPAFQATVHAWHRRAAEMAHMPALPTPIP